MSKLHFLPKHGCVTRGPHWDHIQNGLPVQLNQYETAPYFSQFSQNLTFYCLLISVFYLVSTWIYHNLSDLKLKLFSTSKEFNFRFRSGKFWWIEVKRGKTQKSANNCITRFDLIEKYMKLSHIHLAVLLKSQHAVDKSFNTYPPPLDNIVKERPLGSRNVL